MDKSKELRLKLEFLIRCVDDAAGVWQIIYVIKRLFGLKDKKLIQNSVLQIALKLLSSGFIVAGFPQRDGSFSIEQGAPDKIIDRMRKEWDALGKDPTPADLFWFYITDKGREELERLQKTEIEE